MKRRSILVGVVLWTWSFHQEPAMALMPHKFWSNRLYASSVSGKRRPARSIPSKSSSLLLCMYFDDCERLGQDLWSKTTAGSSSSLSIGKQWGFMSSESQEKQLAIEKLLGYNLKKANQLSPDQIEEETLRWAVDTNLVWEGDDDNEGETKGQSQQHTDTTNHQSKDRRRGYRYDIIKDLWVASSCHTLLDSLAYVWNVLADALEKAQPEESDIKHSSDHSSSCVHLIVFPNSEPLWNYDTMVHMLMAIQISKPFLSSIWDIHLDLFHPHYKHSPRMWSPERHSPFPTIGISLQPKKKKKNDDIFLQEQFDIEAVRAKLDILFQSMDAEDYEDGGDDYTNSTSLPTSNQGGRKSIADDQNEFQSRIIQESSAWLALTQPQDLKDLQWSIPTHQGPCQLYKTLWNMILAIQETKSSSPSTSSSSIVVVPNLDSYTLYRVAVTVNVALIRLHIPVRITQVYTKSSTHNDGSSNNRSNHIPPPYGMIQLSPTIIDGIP